MQHAPQVQPVENLRMSHPSARRELFFRLARGIVPRAPMTVSEWADAHRVISSKQGGFAGPWRTDRNPLLREPMDALARPRGVTVLMFPIQLGKTEVLLNAIGHTMDRDPCPAMVCLPGEVSLNKWVAQKLQPMIDETAVVRASLSSVASREASNTRTFKDFHGGQLYIEHAGTPSRLKSTTVRKLYVDELDEFAANLTGGDDPVEMLDGRTSAFPNNFARAYVSTPQMRSTSRIWQLWEKSDQRRYHLPCPHCGTRQHLQWSGLKWGTVVHSAHPRRAWYVCCDCGCEIEEHAKTSMMAAGIWVPGQPDESTRGYTANCLYYPLGLGPRWADMAQRWLDVQGEPARLKTFVNDRLAEPWEDDKTRNVVPAKVQERTEAYALRTAPAGVLAVTAGVDTQDDRLEAHIVGWGHGFRSFWVLDYVVLPGDPEHDEVWTALTDLLNRPILHASGALLGVEATSIDMLGHRTEAVKHYVRNRRIRRAMASFGAVPNTAPVLSRAKLMDVTYRGKTDKRGVHVYQVGTVAAKHVLFARLAADAESRDQWLGQPDSEDKPAAAPQLCHFSEDLPEEFFKGLVSEVFNPTKNRFEKRRGGVRNEPLDTWVHAFAAAHHPELRLHRLSKAEWDSRERKLLARAPQADATDAADAAQPAAPAAHPATPAPRPGTAAAAAPAPVAPRNTGGKWGLSGGRFGGGPR